jgi:hypothetical protein
MTCTEFKRLSATDAALFAMTRAERIASAKHYVSCRKCRRFIDRSVPDDPHEPLENRVQRVIDLILEEEKYPETS